MGKTKRGKEISQGNIWVEEMLNKKTAQYA